MERCGSEWEVSEMLLAGPERTPEEVKDFGENRKGGTKGNPGEDRRNAPSAVTLAH